MRVLQLVSCLSGYSSTKVWCGSVSPRPSLSGRHTAEELTS